MFPRFRRDAAGGVSLGYTQEAWRVKHMGSKRKWEPAASYDIVQARAVRRCKEAGGDENVAKQWMGFLTLEWGEFGYEIFKDIDSNVMHWRDFFYIC